MRTLFPALLLVLIAPLEAAVAAPAAAPPAPADDEPNWTIGVTAFAGRDLSPENLYLLHSFPLALRERLSSVRLHFFTPEQRAGYQRAVIRRAARSKGSELEKLRRERDALFFQDKEPAELAAAQASYDLRISRAVEELARLAELDPAVVEFPEHKEVHLADGKQGELLLPEASQAPLAAAAGQKVNLLIYGSFEEIQDYLYLEVRAVDAALEREVYAYTDAVGREAMAPAMEAAIEGLTRILWGRDWASLALRVSPPEARIYLDGTLLGAGEVRLDFVNPGEHALRFELEGHNSLSRQVSVPPYSLTELDLELEKLPESLIAVGSTPEGAALYRGSTWLGVTPLEVARPEVLARFLLRLEGFRDAPLYLGPSSPATLAVELAPAAADPLERQKRERNRFYTAFGLFALSLPLPIYSWRFVNDSLIGFESAWDRGDMVEAQRLSEAETGYYYAYLGTLGLTLGLAANMLFQLVRYIRAADRRG